MTAPITNTVSTFIDSQLPEFIRENNPNFGAFLKAYYAWMETSNTSDVTTQSKMLMSYKDIDRTTDDFIQFFINDFLPYFPNEVALNETKLLKVARNFYQKKGSVESIQFLFRVLYNKEANIYFPKDNILKASDGKWVLPQALQLVLSPPFNNNFDVQQLVGRQGLGSISNASCIIESAEVTIDPNLGIEILQLFISNITQEFSDLENLNVIYGVDGNNNPLVFTEKIIAAISNIVIDPLNRGTKYRGFTENNLGVITYPGDPVVVSGGLSLLDPNARKALAYVGNVTLGSITSVVPIFGGYGYEVFPNSIVTVVNAASDLTGSGGNVIVSAIDTTPANVINLLINTDCLAISQSVALNSNNFLFTGFAFANANTPLNTAFSYTNVQFGSITTMNVINGGGGYSAVPSLTIQDTYHSDSLTDPVQYIDDLGIICAVSIVSGGSGYSNVTDTIVVPSAIGYNGAFSFITSNTGAITNIAITNRGEGYIELPYGLAVKNSANLSNASAGSGASLIAWGFGQGATFQIQVNQIGQIIDFRLISRGFDYISTPTVSLRIQDFVIKAIPGNVSFTTDSVIFQGSNANSATWSALVDSYNVSTSTLRVYNYQGALNLTQNLISTTTNAQINLSSTSNVTTYGDGKAKANAIFLNGLIDYPGFWLTTDGFLSSDQYLQDSNTYHNFSYVIVVEEALNTYKKTLMDLVHPTGTSMLGQFSIVDDKVENTKACANVEINPLVAGLVSINAFGNGFMTGVGTGFGTTTPPYTIAGNVGDMITFNTSDSSRYLQSKFINTVINSTAIILESNTMFAFQNPVTVTNGSNVISAINVFGNVAINDIVETNVNSVITISIVQVVSQNTISVNTVFGSNATNIVMLVWPSINSASYVITGTAH